MSAHRVIADMEKASVAGRKLLEVGTGAPSAQNSWLYLRTDAGGANETLYVWNGAAWKYLTTEA